jgi:hypothetical protein
VIPFKERPKLEVSENVLWNILEAERDVMVNSVSNKEEIPYLCHSPNVFRLVLRKTHVEPFWKAKVFRLGDWRVTVMWTLRQKYLWMWRLLKVAEKYT